MAIETVTRLVDDLTGEEAERTVSFGIDGARYEIELSAANCAEFTAIMERYITAARRVAVTKTPPKTRLSFASAPKEKPKMDPEQRKAITAWATDHGMHVPARGRIPTSVLDAWEQAHAPRPRRRAS